MTRRCSFAGLPCSITLCGGMPAGMSKSLSSAHFSAASTAAFWCPKCGGLKLPP